MNEHAAREVVLMRAIETADGAREIWTDGDRAWATRAAAEVVGERATESAFVGERAALALRRLAGRHPKLALLSRRHGPWAWSTPLAMLVAFIVGAAGVEIGPAHRINLLAPPVLALLAWNIVVYAMLGVAALRRGGTRSPGPLRRNVAAWLETISRPSRASRAPVAFAAALARYTTEWTSLAMPLWQQRAARILHASAASLAAGAIAGLYVRGIALEYRAAWQSTFLDATDVARLLGFVLAPGSWLTGIDVPGASHLATIGAASAGENAAPWIHLYAATVLSIVIVPRAALAAVAALREHRLSSRFPLSLGHAYFQRLLRGWHEGIARIAAIAYSYAIPPANADGLARVMARVFPSAVDVAWLPAAQYGADDVPALPASPLAAVVAVFNLSATPERENHGAFLSALAARAADRAPLLAIVDTTDFASRFAADPRRIEERRASWAEALAAYGCEPLFARLAAPDVAEVAATVATRLERAAT